MRYKFSDLYYDDTKNAKKLKSSEYKNVGKYIIVDQGKSLIAGYTDDEDGLYADVPAIIFGDHTRNIKYIDSPFFLGADGTKVLKSPLKNVNYKYLYYLLKNASIPDTGYNRHFKWLKELIFKCHSQEQQNRIVTILDKLDLTITKYREELSLLDELVKARFVEMFGEIEDCDKWKSKIWNEVVTIQNGRDYKKVLVSDGGYPVVGTGGEIARSSGYLCPENTIVVGRKGSINNPMLMREKFWNVDTAFGVIPNSDYLHYQYFYYFCKFYNFMKLNKATTLPSTTKADLLKIRINIPPLELQNQFASFVEEIDKSRSRIQKSLEASQELFDSLMQEYFG